MSDLQWQKERCVEWLFSKWLQCASEELTRDLMHRMAIRLEPEQLDETKLALDSMTDQQFAEWLTLAAKPWQQQLLWGEFARMIKHVQDSLPGDPIIAIVATLKSQEPSTRTLLRQMLEGYR